MGILCDSDYQFCPRPIHRVLSSIAEPFHLILTTNTVNNYLGLYNHGSSGLISQRDHDLVVMLFGSDLTVRAR